MSATVHPGDATLTAPRGSGAGLWARWRERRRQGTGALAYHFVRRVVARCRLTRLFELRVHELVAVPPWRLRLPPRLSRGLRVAELTPEQARDLERLRPPMGEPYAVRFAAAHRCVGAWLEDRLVAFVWLRRGPARLPSVLGCTWQLPASMTWIYDIYSHPEVLGAPPYLYAHLRQHPPGDGVQLLAGQTELDNFRSRLAHRSIGYEVLATLWTLHLGGWRFHISRAVTPKRWRWHRGDGLIPLYAFAAATERRWHPLAGDSLKLQCGCGRTVELSGGEFACSCGCILGSLQQGIAVVGPPVPYWGEISQAEMRQLLRRAEELGWREAAEERLPENLLDYVTAPERAAFHELLPLPARARVLELGAGWGGIAAPLARHYRVVALEGVAERARFLALRRRQEGLEGLEIIQGDINTAPLASGQFDAVIANGVLEWSAVLELWGNPREVQTQFLCRLRELLKPGGYVYLGIENRFGWDELRGELDHSGLPYTSLLPRLAARRVCTRREYRAVANTGYRTYTYTYRGYRRLFDEAGLRIAGAWVVPGGYNQPEKMVPLQGAAIRYAQRGLDGGMRALPRRAGAQAWVWRWLGSSFVFLLSPAFAQRGSTGCGPQPALHREVPVHASLAGNVLTGTRPSAGSQHA